MSFKKAPAVQQGSELAVRGRAELATLTPEWQQRLAQYVQQAEATATGGSGWPFIGTRSGVFRLQNEVYDSPIRAIILGAVNENTYYEGDFDPDSPNAPDCFAIGKVGAGDAELAPPADLETRQADKCAGCPMNEFGTAARGRGKACKNALRIALLPADDLAPERLADVEGARLRIPPTSIKNFGKLRDVLVKGYKLPLFGAVVAIHIKPHDKKQFEITFEPVAAIRDDAQLEALIGRMDEATRELESLPPRKSAEDEAPAQPAAPAKGRSAKRGAPRPAAEQALPSLPDASGGAPPTTGGKPQPRKKF